MRVKLTTDRAGVRGYEPWGTVVDVDAAEASRLIAAGQAVAVESATRQPPENAARRIKPTKR